jgi:hypothetical protein
MWSGVLLIVRADRLKRDEGDFLSLVIRVLRRDVGAVSGAAVEVGRNERGLPALDVGHVMAVVQDLDGVGIERIVGLALVFDGLADFDLFGPEKGGNALALAEELADGFDVGRRLGLS